MDGSNLMQISSVFTQLSTSPGVNSLMPSPATGAEHESSLPVQVTREEQVYFATRMQ